MSGHEAESLHQAIVRNGSVVLSLPSAGMLRHYKSRFLGEHEEGLLLESVPSEAALIRELIGHKQNVGVAFKAGHNKVVFASPIRQSIDDWAISEETKVGALLLEFPAQIKAIQRRSNYRVKVPEEFGLSLRVWRIPLRAYIKDQPLHAQMLRAELRDLSTGGTGVRFVGKDGEAPKVSTEDRLRVELKRNDQTLILEGHMRKPAHADATSFVTGITFKKLEDNLEGRQNLATLTRMVGELQRAELRRSRLGMIQGN